MCHPTDEGPPHEDERETTQEARRALEVAWPDEEPQRPLGADGHGDPSEKQHVTHREQSTVEEKDYPEKREQQTEARKADANLCGGKDGCRLVSDVGIRRLSAGNGQRGMSERPRPEIQCIITAGLGTRGEEAAERFIRCTPARHTARIDGKRENALCLSSIMVAEGGSAQAPGDGEGEGRPIGVRVRGAVEIGPSSRGTTVQGAVEVVVHLTFFWKLNLYCELRYTSNSRYSRQSNSRRYTGVDTRTV